MYKAAINLGAYTEDVWRDQALYELYMLGTADSHPAQLPSLQAQDPRAPRAGAASQRVRSHWKARPQGPLGPITEHTEGLLTSSQLPQSHSQDEAWTQLLISSASPQCPVQGRGPSCQEGSWRCQAPRALGKGFSTGQAQGPPCEEAGRQDGCTEQGERKL